MFPIEAGESFGAEANGLFQRPTHRLYGATLQLVAQAVGVDDQAGVGGDGQLVDADGAVFFIHEDIGHDGSIGFLVFVLGEGDALADAIPPRAHRPTRRFRRHFEHSPPATPPLCSATR